MNLESTLKFFSPKSLHISNEGRGTNPDHLTVSDVMAAIGMVGVDAEFGLCLFFAKAGISKFDKERATGLLTQYALEKSPKLVGKGSGRRLSACMRILAIFAIEDYCRSALSKKICPDCNGKGLITRKIIYRNEKAIARKKYLESLPGNIGWLYTASESKAKLESEETVQEYCTECSGKGLKANRCRCNGTGKVLSKVKTPSGWLPIERECERCKGIGYNRLPGAAAFRAVRSLVPELQERTWNRNWRPFFDNLVSHCYREELEAELCLWEKTRSRENE